MKKMGIKAKIGTLILILVVLFLAIGVIYSKTSLGKSPKDLFYQYLAKSFSTEETELSKEAQIYLNKIQEKKSEISGDLLVTDGEQEDMNVTYLIQMDQVAQKMYGKIETEIDTQKSQTELIRQQETWGIKMEELYNKYIAIQNKDLKALTSKFGMDETSIPDKIEMVDYKKLFQIDPDQAREIQKRYQAILEKEIPDQNYTRQQNVTIEGKGIQAEACYILSLNKEEIRNLDIKLLQAAKEDDVLLDLLVEKNTMLSKIDPEEFPDRSKEEFKEEIQKEIEQTEKDDEILDTKISVYVQQDKVLQVKIEDATHWLSYERDNTNTSSHFLLSYKSEEEKEAFVIRMDAKKEEGKTIQEIEVKVQEGQEETKTQMKAEFNGPLSSDVLEGKVEILLGQAEDTVSIKGNIKTDFTKGVTIEDLDPKNSVILNDMSQEQISGLIMSIYGNLLMHSQQAGLPNGIF